MNAASLSPAQQAAFDFLRSARDIGNLFVIGGDAGSGKTTVLRALHAEQERSDAGGSAAPPVFLSAADFVTALERQPHPLAVEEAVYSLLHGTLEQSDAVFVDDLHLICAVACSNCGNFGYPRPGLLDVPMMALAASVRETGKRLYFVCADNTPGPIRQRCISLSIESFTATDYAHLCAQFLGEEAAAAAAAQGQLDYEKVFRFAPRLNAHQLKGACAWLRHTREFTTDAFIEYLRSQHMTSNVQLGEVQEVDLHDLKGVDDIIESLEANIVLPLENDDLSAELGIKPKRGVLLAGPPGTGKTTIGRALAHRLKSKFFLIDGTFISGTPHFYSHVHRVFEAAKENAPSVIFVDDSDVIFESGAEAGLYRYLLTMLDGLESKSAGRVCVMMTAMNVANLPPALLRSGRIELWLETRLPDAPARAAILEPHLSALPQGVFGAAVDTERIVEATEGLTGADLRRLVEDGKLLYAHDRARNLPLAEPTEYFLRALQTILDNKEKYAEAEASARARQPVRPPWFDVAGGMMSEMMLYAAGEEDGNGLE